MKQHITVKQLEEITYDQAKELLDISGLIVDVNELYFGNNEDSLIEKISQKFTIGKMIEILKSNGYGEIEMYEQYIGEPRDEKYKECVMVSSCDALWEAVKYVLEGK